MTRSLLPKEIIGDGPPPGGRFGPYGGQFVPETLMTVVKRLEAVVVQLLADRDFMARLEAERRDFIGRPTPLTPAPGLGRAWGAEVYLTREDLCHTGAHKLSLIHI